MRSTSRFQRHDPGQSLVEFALIAPLLVAVIFGIVELAILFNCYISVTNTAREAARAGSIYQETTAIVTSSDATAADTRRKQYITQIITDTISPVIDPVTDVTVTVSYNPATADTQNLYRAGDAVAVQLAYTHQLFFGLLGPKTITLNATSSMRIELGGTQ